MGCRLRNGRCSCAALRHFTGIFMFKSTTEGADLRMMVKDKHVQLGSYKNLTILFYFFLKLYLNCISQGLKNKADTLFF